MFSTTAILCSSALIFSSTLASWYRVSTSTTPSLDSRARLAEDHTKTVQKLSDSLDTQCQRLDKLPRFPVRLERPVRHSLDGLIDDAARSATATTQVWNLPLIFKEVFDWPVQKVTLRVPKRDCRHHGPSGSVALRSAAGACTAVVGVCTWNYQRRGRTACSLL